MGIFDAIGQVMGLNDRHFTNPDRGSWQTPEQHRDDISFRQQLAGAFRVTGPHNVQMETGHVLLPLMKGRDPGGPQVAVHHPDDEFDRTMYLPLGRDPQGWMGDLARHLGNRDVMRQMRDQMTSGWGD